MVWQRRIFGRDRQPKSTLFMHVAAIAGRHQAVYDSLAARLINSGLAARLDAAHINVVGDESLKIGQLSEHVTVEQHCCGELSDYEFSTLQLLHSFSCISRGENVLYLHAKGVRLADPSHVEASEQWVDFMSERLIDRFEECLDHLNDGWDLVGVDWANTYRGRRVPPHFSGNFWWAATNYLRRLPAISKIRRRPMKFRSLRHNAEFWVGMRDPNAMSLCHFKSTGFGTR